MDHVTCRSCDHAVDHVTMCVGHVTMCGSCDVCRSCDHAVDHVTMCVGHVTMLGDYVCGSQDMVRGECIDCELKFCK